MGSKESPLGKDDEWVPLFSAKASEFEKECRELGEKYLAQQGKADAEHLHKIILWSNLCCVFGLATVFLTPNPLTILALSTWTVSRWTMIGHHVCHGGYDNVSAQKILPGRFHRFKWALGSVWRRACDWMDWMLPEAWNCEHNQQHHYKLGEDQDPDLVELNLGWMRDSEMPLILKFTITALLASIWKWFYYAPNTYKELKMHELRRRGQPPPAGVDCEKRTDPATGETYYVSDAITFREVLRSAMGFSTPWFSLYEFITRVVGPYFFTHFVLIPGVVGYLLGDTAFWNCVINLGIAELFTNLHSFIIIVTNHAGGDMYRFRHPCEAKSAQFYLRAVISGVDFATGNDIVDFAQGWLNYQVEHHMFPSLSMLSYQRMQPEIKAICKKYHVPYIQESVFVRLKKTVGTMVGTETMRRYPESYERIGARVTYGKDKNQ